MFSEGTLVEAGGPGVQGYPLLHNKLKASLNHMSPCLSETKIGAPF